MTVLIPLPGVPLNFSLLAAMSAGVLPANVQATTVKGAPNPTLLALLTANALPANTPATGVTFASTPGWGGT
jgi:hypothetical protein